MYLFAVLRKKWLLSLWEWFRLCDVHRMFQRMYIFRSMYVCSAEKEATLLGRKAFGIRICNLVRGHMYVFGLTVVCVCVLLRKRQQRSAWDCFGMIISVLIYMFWGKNYFSLCESAFDMRALTLVCLWVGICMFSNQLTCAVPRKQLLCLWLGTYMCLSVLIYGYVCHIETSNNSAQLESVRSISVRDWTNAYVCSVVKVTTALSVKAL